MRESRYNVWAERLGADYVYNGVSGALLRLEGGGREGLERFLAGANSGSCDAETLVALARGRMLVPDEHDELGLLRSRYELSRYDTSSFTLTIVTSLGCNFDCPYCFEAKHPSIMSAEVEKAVLDVLDDQLPRITSLYVMWFGGEPLVGKKPLLNLSDAFIKRCQSAGVAYGAGITTNGYLLDEATCVQLEDRNVGTVQVSLDGPPEIHDRMRPLANGKGSFWHIVQNLHYAVEHFDVSVRINADRANFGHAEELLKILAAEGLAGRLRVYVGQIVGVNDLAPSPSASYHAPCFRNAEFAEAELAFVELAARYGFANPLLPTPTGAPCTAVRTNELVVGSMGELYKCWDSVGNRLEVIGDIRDYRNPNGRLQKWLKYDPFADAECQSCIALPVCMGGCAHHAMDPMQYENRCGTFRRMHREQVLAFIEMAEERGTEGLIATSTLARRLETR